MCCKLQNLQDQTKVQKFQPQYPSNVFATSQRGFQSFLSPNSSIKLLHFTKDLNNNTYTIVFQISPNNQYQGIKFILNTFTGNIQFLQDFVSPNLNFLMQQLQISKLNTNISQYYPNLTQEIRQTQQFQFFLQQQNNLQPSSQFNTNQNNTLLNYNQIQNYLQQNPFITNQLSQPQNNIYNNNIYPSDQGLSQTIFGTNVKNLNQLFSQNYQPTLTYGNYNQAYVYQRLLSIPQKRNLITLIPGISSWSLLTSNDKEFQEFLDNLSFVLNYSNDVTKVQNLDLLFSRYNLNIKNMTQYEIMYLQQIIQRQLFNVQDALNYINRETLQRQLVYFLGQGYDMLIYLFLFIIRGGQKIPQTEVGRLIQYIFSYGTKNNVPINEQLFDLLKDSISILFIGKPNNTFVSVLFDIIRQNNS